MTVTPESLAKSGTEAAHQTALFCWAACAELRGFEAAEEFIRKGAWPDADAFVNDYVGVPELKWLHSSTYGASLGDDLQSRKIRGGRAKAQGMRSGVADIFLPVKRGAWSGLFIELKKPDVKAKKKDSKGGLSYDQIDFGRFVIKEGFGWMVCYGWLEAKDALKLYINFK
jgi:hypothetical protein